MAAIHARQVDWSEMPDMGEEALEGFSPRDSALFREIRDALAQHNALSVFGLYLVHKHFEISSDEEMVEHVDFNRETVTIHPCSRRELDMRTMNPTNWFFSAGEDEDVVVHVAQWGKRVDMPTAEQHPFASRFTACFSAVRKILARHGATKRFGMFLLRHQFSFDDAENQLECTDQDTRTLTLTRNLRSNDNERSIPTNWFFTPDEIVAVGCCECARNTGGHLGYHRQR